MPERLNAALSLDGSDWSLYHLMPSEWLWRRVWEKRPPEAVSRLIRATVPGDVQSDLLDIGELPHPYQGLNSRLWEWTSARDWIYEREFTLPPEMAGDGRWLELQFDGIDYRGHVFLNGEKLGEHAGTMRRTRFDVTGRVSSDGPNRLLVVVEHAPEEQGQIGWTSRVRHWKPRFAYDWDWCTRLVPLGLWDSVRLTATGPVRLRDTWVSSNLSVDRREASVTFVHELESRADQHVTVRTRVTHAGLPIGEVADVITAYEAGASLVQGLAVPRPQLWWPNGEGRQPLYEATTQVEDEDGCVLDERRTSFGIRQVRFVPNDGAFDGALPYTLEVNGRKVFMKGWNWVPLDQLYGRPRREQYERLLRLARDANANMLRVWGGGLLEREHFYDLCDRYGIMVWQEFCQSSSGLDNKPPADEDYLDMARETAEEMIVRRRNHPSLVIWAGGNELTRDDYTPLDEAHPALETLAEAVALNDPGRLWLPTSPSGPVFAADPENNGRMGDVHGPWVYLGPTEHYRFFNGIEPLLHSEFGCEGAANVEALLWLAGDRDLWPPDESNPLWVHHGAWWLHREKLEGLFGPNEDLGTFVRASQWMQAEGLRYAVEAHRRRKWQTSGALPWQFNEAWPNAACTNAVDWFGVPRPAYWWLKRAYAPLHVSARYETLEWHGRRDFECEVWLHHSGDELPLSNFLNVTVTVADFTGRVFYQENLAADAPARRAECLDRIVARLPEGFADVFVLLLQVIDEESEVQAENFVLFSAAPPPIMAPALHAPETRLSLIQDEGTLEVRNEGAATALMVHVGCERPAQAFLSDNDFLLPAGEARRLLFEGDPGRLSARAWNAPEVHADP
jgi:beta-mannosidase